MDRTAEIEAVLRRNNWFRDQSPTLVDSIFRHSVSVGFTRGKVIYSMGDAGGACYMVISGGVRISYFSASGEEVLLSIHRAGEWFGELSEIDGLQRPNTAVAGQRTELLMLPRTGLRQVVQEAPEFNAFLAGLLAGHMRRALELLVHRQTLSIRGRIAQVLLDSSPGSESGVEMRGISQFDLAAMAGVSRQTVSKFLQEFRREGSIAIGYQKIEILDRHALHAAIDDERE